jgi:hypothetical protein
VIFSGTHRICLMLAISGGSGSCEPEEARRVSRWSHRSTRLSAASSTSAEETRKEELLANSDFDVDHEARLRE